MADITKILSSITFLLEKGFLSQAEEIVITYTLLLQGCKQMTRVSVPTL